MRRPKSEEFYVEVALRTHEYKLILNQYVGALNAFLRGDFGRY